MTQRFYSGYILEGNRITVSKKHLHPHVHCSIYTSQGMETTQMSMEEYKENVSYTCILSR